MIPIQTLLAATCTVACTHPPPPLANSGIDASHPPSLAELRARLPHVTFKSEKRGCVAEDEIDAYAGQLVQAGRDGFEAGDHHTLTGGCGAFPAAPLPTDPPRDDAYWFCTVDAEVVDPWETSPWHYMLHVRIRKADGLVDVATAACL